MGKSRIKLSIGHNLAASGTVSVDPSLIKKIIKKEALYVGSRHSKGKRHKDEIFTWNNQSVNQYNIAMTYNDDIDDGTNTTIPLSTRPASLSGTTGTAYLSPVTATTVSWINGNIGWDGSNIKIRKRDGSGKQYKKQIVSKQAQRLMEPLLQHFHLVLPELIEAASSFGSGWTINGHHRHKTDILIAIKYESRGVGNKYYINLLMDNGETVTLSRSLTLSEAVTDTLKLIKLIGL